MPEARVPAGVLEDLQTKKIEAAPAAAKTAPVFDKKPDEKVIEQVVEPKAVTDKLKAAYQSTLAREKEGTNGTPIEQLCIDCKVRRRQTGFKRCQRCSLALTE